MAFLRPDCMWRGVCILAVALLVAGTGCPQPGGDEPPPPPPSSEAVCDASRSGAAPRARTAADVRELSTGRIVGGDEADQNAWPWAAAIAFVRPDGTLFQYCGGSLIAPGWVLTAAHCEVQDGDRVILGRHDLTTAEGEILDVDFVLTHNDYNSGTNDSDIALVRLASPSGQMTVGLIDAADSPSQPGADSTIAGWGALSEGGATSTTLQQVTIPIVSNDTCEAGYAPDGVTITGNMLCAGLEAGQMDSCQGDSGGPLMVQESEQDPWLQAGIVSFGIGCARPGKFGVYTRVSRFLPWVEACRANPPS